VLDPIFQGLAVALMSGAVVATLLTMVVVPLLYWELRRREAPVTTMPTQPTDDSSYFTESLDVDGSLSPTH
jgi:hypothetical protein